MKINLTNEQMGAARKAWLSTSSLNASLQAVADVLLANASEHQKQLMKEIGCLKWERDTQAQDYKARIAELEAQAAAAEKTLYDIAGALDYVDYGEGTGGYRRIDDARLVTEVAKAQQAVRCVEDRSAHLRDALERIVELEAKPAEQAAVEPLSDELRREAEWCAGEAQPFGGVARRVGEELLRRFPKPGPPTVRERFWHRISRNKLAGDELEALEELYALAERSEQAK